MLNLCYYFQQNKGQTNGHAITVTEPESTELSKTESSPKQSSKKQSKAVKKEQQKAEPVKKVTRIL